MSNSSLISYLPAPVLVVDPEGHIIYANPLFESRFSPNSPRLQGEDLANIFEGGGREAVLGAVADVCSSGGEVNFRLIEGGRGYLAVASPIESEDSRVGVMVLLLDEPKSDERLLRFHGQIQEPLDEVRGVLEELLEQTGGRRSESHRTHLERAITAVGRVGKWSDDLRNVILGKRIGPGDEQHEPSPIIRGVVAGLASQFSEANVELDLLMPAQLPNVLGSETTFETALMQLLRFRLSDTRAGGRVSLSVRELGSGDRATSEVLMISVVDRPIAFDLDAESFDPREGEPEVLQEAVSALGGNLYCAFEPTLGRVTSIHLKLA